MEIRRIYNQTVQLIKDTIFPAYCLGCNVEGKFVCSTCYKTLDISGVFCCPVCHLDNKTGAPCNECAQKISIDRHIAITAYHEDGLIGNMMHAFKYQYTQDIISVFEAIIKDFLNSHPLNVDIIIPVPLHKRRYVERGFNQAEILAQRVAIQLAIPMSNNVRRARYTRQQAKLNREERLKNLDSAFVVDDAEKLVGKHILIVDDVFTTGSTLNECAKALREVGVGEITSFSIARG